MYNALQSLTIDEEHKYSVGSDHNVLILDITSDIKDQVMNTDHVNEEVKRWNINEDTDWVAFQTDIKEHLDYWDCRQYTNIDDMWLDLKDKLIKVGGKSVGCKTYPNKKVYWDKEVDNLIRNRKLANKIYRAWSKKPQCSPEILQMLWDDYMEKKKLVADRIRTKAYEMKLKVITENAAKASKNPRAYWQMLSKLNKSNDYPLRSRDPSDPNVIIDDPVKIKQVLTEYWASLGKTQDKDTQPDSMLENPGMSLPSDESLQNIKFDKISIESAINKLKNGKAVGPDLVPGEFLKYGGPSVRDAILSLFEKIKLLESMPDEWYQGYVKPLYKEGNKEILSNYWAITISSVVYKVLVSTIEMQTMNYLEDNNVPGDYQGAFRKNRRCEDHIFALKGICALQKKKKKSCHLAFLDVSKAFDTINREQLFSHIWKKGIQGKA